MAESKDGWDKLKIVCDGIFKGLLPPAAAIVAVVMSSGLKEKETAVEFVGLAIRVLEKDATSGSENDTRLRRWAVDTLQALGPVPFGNVAEALVKGNASLPIEAIRNTSNTLVIYIGDENDEGWEKVRGAADSPWQVAMLVPEAARNSLPTEWGVRPETKGVVLAGGKLFRLLDAKDVSSILRMRMALAEADRAN